MQATQRLSTTMKERPQSLKKICKIIIKSSVICEVVGRTKEVRLDAMCQMLPWKQFDMYICHSRQKAKCGKTGEIKQKEAT